MKNLLIIYPHWPPSNLAGIHRSRLISNYLPEFGWQPHVVTVEPEYYEEPHDRDICKTVAPHVRVTHVHAREIPRIRFFGDIALRAFQPLYHKALEITRTEAPDFLWIPIPSFYTALLGRRLHEQTKIPYGIDYIDPWVNGFARQEKLFSRAWLSNQLAKILEPYAVKKAALISGVSTAYYQGVLDRNFRNKKIQHVGMPYGFDPNDHKISLDGVKMPWAKISGCKPMVYAGAFLPKSHLFIRQLFGAIAELKKQGSWDEKAHLFFVGTGNYAGKTIENYAQENGISDLVHEIHQRFPFLHILNFLASAYGVMIIGSTEEHYTASKTFQSLLSEKPVFAVFHHKSSAVKVMKQANAAQYLVQWKENMRPNQLKEELKSNFARFVALEAGWNPDLSRLEPYSARQSAQKLAEKLDLITQK